MRQAVNVYGIVLMFAMFSLLAFYAPPVFAHGVGGETLPPVVIDGKNATLSLFLNPPTFDTKTREYDISLKLYETGTQAVIPHVTYRVQVTHDGKQVLDERFHDDSSNLLIKVIPKDAQSVQVSGNNLGDLGWTSGLLSPLQIRGPLFLSGGLYKFHIEILRINDDSNKLNPPVQFDAAISLAETTEYKTSYENNDYDLGIVSYYDKIGDFVFDANSRTISFSMPYEWTTKNIAQTNVVHQEIHIPKTFAELLVTKYDATINGIPIPESAVTIDDYTTDSRVVHLVLYQKEISSIVNSISDNSKMIFTVTPSKQEKFPLEAFTHNAIFQVGLSWDPVPITSDQNTRFFVDITKYFAPKTKENAKFDFVIKQHGNELYRKSVTGLIGAQEKTNYYDYTFSEKNLGPIIISIENINGETLSSADYVIAISPKETKKTFPIRIPSVTQDGIKGNYFVDLTWIPENLQPGEAEFIFTIYDKNLQPVQNAEYNFTLSRNGQELYKNPGVAQAGGSFEDVTFFESNKGPIILEIKNINQSDESITIPIMVTPEFPLGVFLVLGVLFAVVIMIPRLYHKTEQILRHPFYSDPKVSIR